ncbi:MAG: TVP38/TMEM64 family protein [Terrimicrobiaceae bacterium]|nr:TVP38/TMEM64 family protein [Terrimicrobiaceae bacterium]
MFEVWTEWLEQCMLWIQQSGWIGWLWFIVLYTLSCVLFLPGSVLSFGAGAVYGFWPATVLVSLGSVAGAMANFLSARYLLRGWISRRWGHGRRFRAIDRAVTTDGWKLIILTRISPVLPHSLVSCAFGISQIPWTRYLLASWIGFLPISAAYAYAGAVIGKAAKGGLHQGPWAWLAYTIELAITIGVTVWITRAAHRALVECAPEMAEPDPLAEPDPAVPNTAKPTCE